MPQVMVTVEALRCFQCLQPLHPQEPFYRRQMKTAVEVDARGREVARYELVVLCASCDAANEQAAKQDRIRGRWFWLWTAALIVCMVYPYAALLLGPALLWRITWKGRVWWRQHRTVSAPTIRRRGREVTKSERLA